MFQVLSESLYDQVGLCFGTFPRAMQTMMRILICAVHRYAHEQFLCSPPFLFFFKPAQIKEERT